MKHNPIAKHMHKANNRGCFHEEKRDKLLSDTLDRESEESLILYEESTAFNEYNPKEIVVLVNGSVVEYESDYELPCIGCSNIYISEED